MALYGGQRDISLFRHVNRELLRNIISQQCAYYKFRLDETKVNMYGEASGGRYYYDPVSLNVLIERDDQTFPEDELAGMDFEWNIMFKFFRDDLVDANLVPEVGDIIMYQEGYYEVYETNANQYFVGKNPLYPYPGNPLENNLQNFGSSISIICKTHYVPSDKVQITKERV